MMGLGVVSLCSMHTLVLLCSPLSTLLPAHLWCWRCLAMIPQFGFIILSSRGAVFVSSPGKVGVSVFVSVCLQGKGSLLWHMWM